MFNKLFLILTCLACLFISTTVYALRIQRPLVLTYPITEEQVSQLNKFLEEVWLVQQGRVELDIGASKSKAKNGEMWIYKNGSTYTLQVMAGGTVRSATLTP